MKLAGGGLMNNSSFFVLIMKPKSSHSAKNLSLLVAYPARYMSRERCHLHTEAHKFFNTQPLS